MTSCASKVHRASGPGRAKPVLICILACSLGFHGITSERGTFTNEAGVALNPFVSLFYLFVTRGSRIRGRTDIQTDRPSTVTLAAHAHRGLMRFIPTRICSGAALVVQME